jgi:hypothetical protein
MTVDATTYRETKPSKGARRPLAEVHLAGPPRHVHRALAGARIVTVLVAIVTFFMPWHVVHPLSNGSWGDAFCWAPDCHPSPPTTPPPPPAYGPAYACTGWSHANTVLPLALLVVLVVVALVPFRRPRFGLAFLLAIVDVLLLFGLGYALFDLKHMFDHVDVLIGERVFQRTLGTIALFVAADVFVTPILYLWARTRLLRT